MNKPKVFGIFYNDGTRVIHNLLLEEDADILVDDLNAARGKQEFYSKEEEFDGSVAVTSFDAAESECKRDGLLP